MEHLTKDELVAMFFALFFEGVNTDEVMTEIRRRRDG